MDEVHRLPPEGQEMLFTFMDRGVFHRLGDTMERSAKVRLLFATTERPESALLATFVRRIPMSIAIPNLSERTEKERFTLISDFFLAESAKTGYPIHLTPNALRCLLTYRCPNNIGQLKADIQLLCAKAYSSMLSGTFQEQFITSAELPEYIRSALLTEQASGTVYTKVHTIGKRQFFTFDSREALDNPIWDDDTPHASIYDMLEWRAKQLRYKGTSEEEIGSILTQEINQHYSRFFSSANQLSQKQLSDLVHTDMFFIADQILRMAGKALGREFSDTVRNSLAVHIGNATNRIKLGLGIYIPQLNDMRKNFPKEFSVALDALQMMNNLALVNLPIDEAFFLIPFFCESSGPCVASRERFHVMVIMHGNRTASEILNVVEYLYNQPLERICALNLPMNKPLNEAYEQIRQYLQGLPEGSSMLFLYDMGSLSSLIDQAKHEFPNIHIKLCPLVSTLHVIEAVQDSELGNTHTIKCWQ